MCIWVGNISYENFEFFVEKTQKKLKNDCPIYSSFDVGKGEFWKIFEKKVVETMKYLQDHDYDLLKKCPDIKECKIDHLPQSNRFPDIIALAKNDEKKDEFKEGFGLEVKTIISKKSGNSWEVLGGSIMESTRDERVKGSILVLCVKRKNDDSLEYKCGKYEKHIVGVAVTHSPRYVLDMSISDGQDIFSTLNLDYDKVREEQNPFGYFKNISKNTSKNASSKKRKEWWKTSTEIEYSGLDESEHEFAKKGNLVNFKFWDEIGNEKRKSLLAQIFVSFPNVFYGNYKDAGRWLVASESIICNNLRDKFSAHGRGCVKDSKYPNEELSRIYINMNKCKGDIIQVFVNKKSELSFNEWEKAVKTAIQDNQNDKYFLTGNKYKIVCNILKEIEQGVNGQPNRK